MASSNENNLIPFDKRTESEQRELARLGGIASGEARRKKAIMRKTLELMLEEEYKKDGKGTGKTYRELATLGLIKGAVKGNAQNYRTILETLGELKMVEEESTNGVLDDLLEALNNVKKS